MKKLPDDVVKYYQNLEDKILADVIKDIKKNTEISGTSRGKIESLLNLNYDLNKIKKELNKELDITAYKLGQTVNKAGLKSYAEDVKAYEFGGKKLKNKSVLKMVDTMSKSSVEDLKNLTGTIGLEGKPLESWYKDKLNQAIIDVTSGAYSSTEVIRKTVSEVGEKGLEFIEYQSGKSFSVESAIKMNINSTVNRLSAEISLANAKEMNQDLMEITAHAGARPTHQEWQGQIVSLSGNKKYLSLNDIGYGTAEGFMGVNCRHNWYPFFEGLSKQFWDDESLKKISPFKYSGKIYDEYKANQRLRNLNRSVRKHDRKAKMYKSVGYEDAEITENIKKQRLLQEKNKFEKVIKNNTEMRYNRFEDIDNADAFFRPQTSKYWEMWTDKEKKALYDYTRASDYFNFTLRDNKPIKEDVQNLINALDKTSLRKNTVVFRGVDEGGFRGLFNIDKNMDISDIDKLKEAFTGTTVTDKGFVSTGVNTKGSFGRDFKYEIKCPKGTKGAYVEPFSAFGGSNEGLSWNGESYTDRLDEFGENEFIIQAGTPMEVLDIYKEGRKVKVILEVLL